MNTTPMASRSIELLPLPFDRSWGLPELESALRSRNIPIPVGPTWDCLRPAIEQTAALLSANPRRAPWGSYLMVDEARGRLSESAPSKMPPSEEESR